jgi:hypothetical protein
MQTENEGAIRNSPKVPWNKGKLLGAKPPQASASVQASLGHPNQTTG